MYIGLAVSILYDSIRVLYDVGFAIVQVTNSVVVPNRLCSYQDPDPVSYVHSDPAPDPNRVRRNSDPP